MTDFQERLVLALVPAIITSSSIIFAAWWLAPRQHHSQKWWELKAEAYSRIIECLASAKYILDIWLKEAWGMVLIDPPTNADLNKRHSAAKEQLIRASHIGAFIISTLSVAVLDRLLASMDAHEQIESNRWQDAVEADSESIREAIAEIRKLARMDLGV